MRKAGALPDYDEQGLNRLLDAIYAGPAPGADALTAEEGMEAAHCAAEHWDLILKQVEQAADWTRGNLGLTRDGFSDAELSPRQAGARVFLRHLAVCMLPPRPTHTTAAELHGLIFGNRPTDVTWKDLQWVLEGRSDQADLDTLRRVVGRIRQGETQRQIIAAEGVSHHQVEALSTFLGIKAWREESKRRAAQQAVRDGLTPRQLSEDYNAGREGKDQMGLRRARELMAEVRAQVEAQQAIDRGDDPLNVFKGMP